MEIGLYEEWMKPQVSKLFSMQYGISEQEFSALMTVFYEDDYQRTKRICIVAKEGDKIIGFQSFFFWPYTLNGKTFNSYQSGNSLVHPDHRGKGIFQRLLAYLDEHRLALNIDFLVGFPIEASRGSLLRNGWNNLLDLSWHVRPVSLFSIVRPFRPEDLRSQFPASTCDFRSAHHDLISLSVDPRFRSWKQKLYPAHHYFYFSYEENNHHACFSLKLNIRKKYIRELIIGGIDSDCQDPAFAQRALKELHRRARRSGQVTILSIAVNLHANTIWNSSLAKSGFRRIEKKIYFCIKPFAAPAAVSDKKSWLLYRGDIDTW